MQKKNHQKTELLCGWWSSSSSIYEKDNGQLGIFLPDNYYYATTVIRSIAAVDAFEESYY